MSDLKNTHVRIYYRWEAYLSGFLITKKLIRQAFLSLGNESVRLSYCMGAHTSVQILLPNDFSRSKLARHPYCFGDHFCQTLLLLKSPFVTLSFG